MLGLHSIVDHLRHLPVVPPVHRRQARVLRARRPPESAAWRGTPAVLDCSRRHERREGAAPAGGRYPARLTQHRAKASTQAEAPQSARRRPCGPIGRPSRRPCGPVGSPAPLRPNRAPQSVPRSAICPPGERRTAAIRRVLTRGTVGAQLPHAPRPDPPDVHPGNGRRGPIRRSFPGRETGRPGPGKGRPRAPSARADYPGLGATARSRARAPPVREWRIAPAPSPRASPPPAGRRVRHRRASHRHQPTGTGTAGRVSGTSRRVPAPAGRRVRHRRASHRHQPTGTGTSRRVSGTGRRLRRSRSSPSS